MTTHESQALPAPPGLIASLTAGFDAIASHASLLLFPIALDILLWLGPHLRLKQLIEAALAQIMALSVSESPQTVEMMRANQDLWQMMADRFNLLVALRAYPVGVPSLMTGRLPVEMPNTVFSTDGIPGFLEVRSLWIVAGLWLLLSVAGLLVGTLYYSLVAQAALSGQVSLGKALAAWPWASLQVLALTLVLGAILLAISLPASCFISGLALVGLSLGQCAVAIFGVFLVWLLFPLLLSAHGIFVSGNNVLVSLRRSLRLTRQTMPTTGLLFLAILVLSQGLNLLWNVPEEDSWLMLVGVAGHAFVTSGLLAASFVYYRDADQWVQKMMELRQAALAQQTADVDRKT